MAAVPTRGLNQRQQSKGECGPTSFLTRHPCSCQLKWKISRPQVSSPMPLSLTPLWPTLSGGGGGSVSCPRHENNLTTPGLKGATVWQWANQRVQDIKHYTPMVSFGSSPACRGDLTSPLARVESAPVRSGPRGALTGRQAPAAPSACHAGSVPCASVWSPASLGASGEWRVRLPARWPSQGGREHPQPRTGPP